MAANEEVEIRDTRSAERGVTVRAIDTPDFYLAVNSVCTGWSCAEVETGVCTLALNPQ